MHGWHIQSPSAHTARLMQSGHAGANWLPNTCRGSQGHHGCPGPHSTRAPCQAHHHYRFVIALQASSSTIPSCLLIVVSTSVCTRPTSTPFLLTTASRGSVSVQQMPMSPGPHPPSPLLKACPPFEASILPSLLWHCCRPFSCLCQCLCCPPQSRNHLTCLLQDI